MKRDLLWIERQIFRRNFAHAEFKIADQKLIIVPILWYVYLYVNRRQLSKHFWLKRLMKCAVSIWVIFTRKLIPFSPPRLQRSTRESWVQLPAKYRKIKWCRATHINRIEQHWHIDQKSAFLASPQSTNNDVQDSTLVSCSRGNNALSTFIGLSVPESWHERMMKWLTTSLEPFLDKKWIRGSDRGWLLLSTFPPS